MEGAGCFKVGLAPAGEPAELLVCPRRRDESEAESMEELSLSLLPPRGPAEAALLAGMANLVGMTSPRLLPDPAPEVAPDVDRR